MFTWVNGCIWQIIICVEKNIFIAFLCQKRTSGDSDFSKINISRNIAGENDVTFDLKYCGICHTDVNVACNDGGSTHYPCVPGHQLPGVVTKVKNSRLEIGKGQLRFSCNRRHTSGSDRVKLVEFRSNLSWLFCWNGASETLPLQKILLCIHDL